MSDLHVLLVGVDHYDPQRVPGVGLISDLQGCVHDVERMETFLRKGPLAVPPERIRKLLSPPEWPPRPALAPAPEDLPTYRNLIREIQALEERAQPGDQVLVHYSGHGVSLPTAVPEKKGRAGRDECLVPCNAAAPREEGGGFLRDVELHALLLRLAEHGLRVTLVLDSCHSGGAMRDVTRGRVRGLGHLALPPGESGPLGTWEELGHLLQESRRARKGKVYRHVEGASGWFSQPEGCVLLAACRATELAREYPFEDGRWSGALTHFFLDAAGDMGPRPTYRWLHHRLLGRIRGLFDQQTPVLEGDGEVAFLGRERWPARRGIPVLETARDGRVLLGAGRAQGVGRGARLEVRADGGGGKRVAELEVIDVAATSAWARARSTSPSATDVAAGDLAVVMDPGPDVRRYRVGTLAEAGIDPEHRQALDLVHEAIASRPGSLLAPAESGGEIRAEADFLVEVMPEGAYRILDPSTEPVPHQGQALFAGQAGAAEKLVERLEQLAHFRAVADLDNPDTSSPLFGRLHAELFTLDGTEDWQDPGSRIPVGACPVPTGTNLYLLLRNESDHDLNVAVLDLQPDWGIARAHPGPNQGAYTTLHPHTDHPIHLRTGLPDWIPQGRDRLKILAATGPLDTTHLERQALGQSTGYRTSRGPGDDREPRDSRDLRIRLLNPSYSGTRFRTVETVAPVSHDWAVETVEVGVTLPETR